MFALSEDDLAAQQTSSDGTQWASARFVADAPADEFDGRLRDARDYLEGPVAGYLERLTA